MPLLVCAATAKELNAAAPSLLPADIEEMRPMVLTLPHGREAIFMSTGVGPVNAALAIGHCLGLTHANPIKAILLVGLAGAFDLERQPLCSIWRVNREIWPEYGLHDGTRVTARAFRFPLWKKADGTEIYESLELADLSALAPWTGSRAQPDWEACPSLTVAGTTASFNRKNDLWNLWHADLENMEGFAVAYAAARAEIPCVEIRVVSNKTGPRSRAEKDFDGALEAMGEILPGLKLVP